MQRDLLESMSDAIESVLHLNHAPGKVAGGQVTPRWVQFLVEPNPDVNPGRVELLSSEISAALGVPSARVTTQRGGAVRIEVPRNDPQPLKLLPLMARIPQDRIPFCTAVLGMAEDGAPQLIRLPSPEVGHVLIAGTTGAGKTTLLQTIVVSLALLYQRRQVAFVIVSLKDSLAPLAGLPHLLRPIITQAEQAAALLHEMADILQQRAQDMVTEPRIVVVIDDIDRLLLDESPEMVSDLTALVQHGREAGVHVISSTDKPGIASFGSKALMSFPVRLVGRVGSAEEARVAAGVAGTGADHLTGMGDFVAVYGPGLIRFQAAYLSATEIDGICRALAAGERGSDIIQASRQEAQYLCERCGHPESEHPTQGCLAFARR